MATSTIVFALIYFCSFSIVSILVLDKAGVKEKLLPRAIEFGVSLAAIQLITTYITGQMGVIYAGVILTLVLSYAYVSAKLKVPFLNKCGIVILLPFTAMLLAASVKHFFF